MIPLMRRQGAAGIVGSSVMALVLVAGLALAQGGCDGRPLSSIDVATGGTSGVAGGSGGSGAGGSGAGGSLAGVGGHSVGGAGVGGAGIGGRAAGGSGAGGRGVGGAG